MSSTATPTPAGTSPATTVSDAHDLEQNPPEESPSDGSKLKTFIAIIKKFIGVSDLATVRFSLPSQLLEPTPNLEYWTYLDSPNAFIAIGTADEPLDRMLEVCRFWFTKDLKYAKGRPCKPYNSCLGEFFRCNWEAEDNAPLISTASMTSGGAPGLKLPAGDPRTASTVSVPKQTYDGEHNTVRISYLTEQTSHHPPVSAFNISCPERGLQAKGFDQLTAKFTGTSIKVMPGEHNLGIFISLERRNNETYQLTHPAAHLGGIFRGALNVTVGEQCYITCPETKIKCILHYSDQGWTRSVNVVDGVIFKYDPANDTKIRIKDVPDSDVLARLHGPWKEKIVFTLGPKQVNSHPTEAQTTIIDIEPLSVAPKSLPPDENQVSHESLQMWSGVTNAIKAKQFSKATQVKQELEEAQRVKAREREANKDIFRPAFFQQVVGNGGRPDLTEKGRQVLERAQRNEWDISDIV